MAPPSVRKLGSGLLLEYSGTTLALDTGMEGFVSLLSHSHADHISGISNADHVIATQATFDTWTARGGRGAESRTVLEYEDSFSQLGVTITALNAGHVIGSSMFLLEFDEGLTVLYTGDFNNVDSIVHTAARPVQADVLITEATYGTPSWIFPNREATHDKIVEAAHQALEKKRIVIFQAYSLGKAQEAIALLQNAGLEIISGNSSIDRVSRVYNQHGNRLRAAPLRTERTRNIMTDGGVIVSSSPSHTIRGLMQYLRMKSRSHLEDRLERYSLSGWTIGRFREPGFPLSAHSDFNGLVRFAQEVNPRIAHCFTENGLTLSNHLSEVGIDAVPLE